MNPKPGLRVPIDLILLPYVTFRLSSRLFSFAEFKNC